MIQAILFGVVCWMAGVLTCCIVRWGHQQALLATPVYVWPVPGRSRHAQEAECVVLAAYMYGLKAQDSTRGAALWDSGLGQEFPTLGRN